MSEILTIGIIAAWALFVISTLIRERRREKTEREGIVKRIKARGPVRIIQIRRNE